MEMFTAGWWMDKLMLAPGILFGLVVHEFCHGYAAYRMGDPTAKWAGRLSLNPLRHLDLLGTVSLFLFRFGWAKPVPVDVRNFRRGRLGIVVTSLAGPLSNLAISLVLGLAVSVVLSAGMAKPSAFSSSWLRLSYLVLFNAFYINIVLAVFNLLPIPPLDGSNVVYGLLPPRAAAAYGRFIGRYGRGVLLAFFFIVFLGPMAGIPTDRVLGWVLKPPIALFARGFSGHSVSELFFVYQVLLGV